MKAEELTVTGMTCASCSARVQRVVGKLAGVKTASVNLATEKLSLEYDESVLSEGDIVRAVEKAGYGIAPKTETRTVTIPIEGMTCAACVARIEKAVGRLPRGARAWPSTWPPKRPTCSTRPPPRACPRSSASSPAWATRRGRPTPARPWTRTPAQAEGRPVPADPVHRGRRLCRAPAVPGRRAHARACRLPLPVFPGPDAVTPWNSPWPSSCW